MLIFLLIVTEHDLYFKIKKWEMDVLWMFRYFYSVRFHDHTIQGRHVTFCLLSLNNNQVVLACDA